jgi:peptidoglycan/xylan/chitin deacetylase (PgdA/CDA1 family)
MRVLRPPVVLVYHGVGICDDADDPDRLVVSPERFEVQLRYLLRRGYRFVTAGELSPDAPPPAGTAVLTFDDGFADWLEHVVPVLRRLGLRASFYVCTGWWDGHHPLVRGDAGRLLDEAGARELVAAGMEIGSHSETHPDLRRLGDDELRRELSASKAAVEELTGEPCRTLAYPYGLSDARVQAAARDAGYELALGWQPGPWRAFDVPRLPAPPRHGPGRLALKLLGVRRRRR